MLILNNEQVKLLKYSEILEFLPKRLRKYLAFVSLENVEEIRLRRGQPLMIYTNNDVWFVNREGIVNKTLKENVTVNEDDINSALELISGHSLYAVEQSLKRGYITVSGGHRIGICGSVVLKNGRIHTINHINALNYRLSREITGAGDVLINTIVRDNRVLNTLIVSPPGCGKTTLLRDLIRQISQKGFKVSVADERNEISAVHNGDFGYNLGFSCDVLEGASKSDAMSILIRSMSPQVIATDEIGTQKDFEIINKAMHSGVAVISTIHSDSRKTLIKRDPKLCKCFDCIVTLSHKNGPGTIEEIYCGD